MPERELLATRGKPRLRSTLLIKSPQNWKYLYRAVDKDGATIEFMLSAKRDITAAKRFFKKMM